MSWLATAAGILLIGISLVDIFLTVLYARSGAGFLSPRICGGIWKISRALTRPLGKKRVLLLSFVGPSLLVVLATAWLLLLVLGFALLYWPGLGTALQASKGPTPTDFLTAVYYSGFSLTTLGLGDIVPKSDWARILTVIEAALGFSVFTLTITYFLSVFSALQRRNRLASTIHQKTAGTGNSSVLTSHLGSTGDRSGAARQLGELASGAADLFESHHFYPVLHYFRFRQRRYALPRMLALLLDTVSLLKTLPLNRIDEIEPEIAQLETACRDILDQVEDDFLRRHFPENQKVSTEMFPAWRRHYRKTLQELRSRGADLISEDGRGEDGYVELRKKWHPEIAALCANMAFDDGEVIASHPLQSER